MTRNALLLAAALATVSLTTSLATSVAGAQVRLPTQPPIRQLGTPTKPSGDSQPVIPVAYRPPPGMCRIWLDNVPPQQQPASTDCASAVRNRPNNGRVIFGDDYVDRRDGRKDKDRKPSERVQVDVPGARPDGRPEGTAALQAPASQLALGEVPRGPGPYAADVLSPVTDARLLEEPGVAAFWQPPQPPARRPATARPRTTPADTMRDDRRSTNERRADARDARRDSVRDAQDRRRADWDARRRTGRDRAGDDRDGRDDRGDDRYDDDRHDPRYDARTGDGRYGDGRYGDAYAGADRRYAPRGRANGTCLDRDGDGWCDDSRTGGGYCRDLDGDGRCDDYPGLASAPYASALPPMRAATDVQHGYGSEAALRWLGTAEVSVRTSELKRTGSPYRAMWMDATSGRLLQVWTDRDGDGIADRIEIYRNGRIFKTIGR